MMYRGLNLVVEGMDATGKSTLVQGLQTWLGQKDIKSIITHHPGSTAVGQEIRTLVKNRKDILMDRYTEQILMSADLCEFISSVLIPNIYQLGITVISDRSNLVSGAVYGLAGEVSVYKIEALHKLALMLNPPPMHVLLLHGDFETIMRRQHHDVALDGRIIECQFQSRGTKFLRDVHTIYGWIPQFAELKGELQRNSSIDWLYRVMHNFVKILPNHRLSIWPLDANLPAKDVLERAQMAVEQILQIETSVV